MVSVTFSVLEVLYGALTIVLTLIVLNGFVYDICIL